MARTGASRRRAVHGRARHRDRERRPPLDPDRSRILAGQPAMGDLRVRARLRRLPAARRPHRGHPRAPADLHGRAGRVHDRLAALRARLVRGVPDRRPRDPGTRRRDDLAGRARDPDDDLRRGPGAEHRARRLGRGRRLRRRRGRPARRRAHGRSLVGVDLLRQHPGRARGARARSRPAHREPRHRGEELRRARGGPRHGRVVDRSSSRSPRATTGAGARPARSASSSPRRRCSAASCSGRTASRSR